MASAAPSKPARFAMAICLDGQNGEAFQRVWGGQMRTT